MRGWVAFLPLEDTPLDFCMYVLLLLHRDITAVARNMRSLLIY